MKKYISNSIEHTWQAKDPKTIEYKTQDGTYHREVHLPCVK